jgi:glycosyltransferase involved in cell wall biosynthesis
MNRRVLMICYHYPPVAGSSGYQRTLNFARNLPQLGWDPLVLTVHPRAYPQAQGSAASEVATGNVQVLRAFALDSARHLSIAGRYPSFFAWPDRWISWWLGAVPLAFRRVRHFRPDLIWSTYPIATAHCIGASWSRLLKRPWVADFRDPMSEDNYPDPIAGKLVRRIERTTVTRAARIVVVTDGAGRVLQGDHPDVPKSRFVTIPNGFDEAAFETAERRPRPARQGKRLELIHSGILYPVERDPRPFFAALRRLLDEGAFREEDVHVRLRATGHDATYRPMIESHRLQGVVTLDGPLAYEDALAEMLAADGLLLFQGAICNHQVPAKVYEYMRAQRPVLALTDPAGDTAGVLRGCGLSDVYRLESADEVATGLRRFIESLRANSAPLAPLASVSGFSRTGQAASLASVFDAVAMR